MILRKWEELPEFMRTDEVRPYYEVLNKRRGSLILKRMMDLVGGLVLLVLLAIPMAIIAVLIKLDSEGPVFYRQERITTYGKHFKIHKFRNHGQNVYSHNLRLLLPILYAKIPIIYEYLLNLWNSNLITQKL